MNIAKSLAEYALKIKAIKLQPNDPFTWASGYRMPIYNDNRLSLFFPEIRELIVNGFVNIIKEKDIQIDIIAGTPTAGIPHGMLLANKLNLPFIYPRKSPKDHGMRNKIEGIQNPTQLNSKKVLLIEDLISTGKSSVEAVNILKENGAIVNYCLSIFTYGFEKADEYFDKNSCKYYSILSFKKLVSTLEENKYFSDEEIKLLKEWQNNPFDWQNKFNFTQRRKKIN